MRLIGNVIKPLAKSVSIPLGLTAAASATDAAIHNKMFRSGARPLNLASRTTLIISNEEMQDIMKMVKSLGKFGLLIKGVSETIQNQGTEQKEGFLRMLLGTLAASLLGNLLKGKGAIGNMSGEGTIRAGEEQLEQVKIFNAVLFFN